MEHVWITKDGRRLTPSEFEDGHLINTIRFIQQRAADMKIEAELDCVRSISFFQGDMAQFSIEQEANQIARMSPDEYLQSYMPIYGELCEEASRRNLQWNVDEEV